jgi:hypothetical protein
MLMMKKSKKTYEYKIAGLDESGKIIVLVNDSKYGDYSVAIDLGNIVDDKIQVEYDFISDSKIPTKVQEQLITDVVANIFETIEKDLNNEE